MSKPVTENALATACPGKGLPNAIQSRMAHGRKTSPATTATAGDEPDAGRPAEGLHAPRHDQPGQADVERLVAGQRGEPDQHAEGDEPRVGQPAAARVAAMRVMSRQAARARTVNGIVESGRAEWRSSGR